jgi:RNA polymerase sigma-70 factor (ECF subfamily)
MTADIVRRAQQGDADAFSTLFQAHKGRVYSLCLRMTSNTAEAEDLTQESFLQVFRKLSTFRGDSAFSTWLYRIAVNTVLMHFRKKSFAQVSLDAPYNDSNGKGDGKTVRREYGTRDNRLAGCVDRISLIRAIRQLPDGYRTVFVLHEVEGYEHREIAEFLDCSTGNSKSQLHKAKLRIRQLLMEPQKATEAEPSRNATRQQRKVRVSVPVENWELELPLDAVLPPRTLTEGCQLPQLAGSNG